MSKGFGMKCFCHPFFIVHTRDCVLPFLRRWLSVYLASIVHRMLEVYSKGKISKHCFNQMHTFNQCCFSCFQIGNLDDS